LLAIASLLVCGFAAEPAFVPVSPAIGAAAAFLNAPAADPAPGAAVPAFAADAATGDVGASGEPFVGQDPVEKGDKPAGDDPKDKEGADKDKAAKDKNGKSKDDDKDEKKDKPKPKPTPPKPKGPPLAVRADKLYVRPDRVLEGVTVLIDDGRIAAVGTDVKVPEGVRTLQAKVVTAGFIDGWSSFALDPAAFGDERISPSSTALDAVDPYVDARWEREVLRGGVTAYRVQTAPHTRIGGLGAVLRFHPGKLAQDSALSSDCSLALTLSSARGGDDVFERAADTERVLGAIADGWAYLQEKNEYKHELAAWEKAIADKQKELDDGFKKAKKDREKAQADAKDKGTEFKEKEYKEDKKPKAPRYDEDREVLARAANGELPVVVEAHSAVQIRALLESARKFKRARLVLAGGAEARRFAKELAELRIPVLLSPQPMGFYVESAISSGGLGLAAELEDAGVEVLLGSGGADGLASRDLPLLASLAVGHGLSPKAALAALTTRPARVFDIADKVGSVEIGREADLVLFDGEPFAAATKVKSVICGGDLVVEE